MTKSQNQEPASDNDKAAKVRQHCSIPEGFGSPMSHPTLQFKVFNEDIRTSEQTFSDLQAEETPFPWSKAA
jgi:hypothetical protein